MLSLDQIMATACVTFHLSCAPFSFVELTKKNAPQLLRTIDIEYLCIINPYVTRIEDVDALELSANEIKEINLFLNMEFSVLFSGWRREIILFKRHDRIVYVNLARIIKSNSSVYLDTNYTPPPKYLKQICAKTPFYRLVEYAKGRLKIQFMAMEQ